jgi:DNA-directed RNA polymerase specialized sigma24 family protein
MEGLTDEEVAEITGLGSGTVRVRRCARAVINS